MCRPRPGSASPRRARHGADPAAGPGDAGRTAFRVPARSIPRPVRRRMHELLGRRRRRSGGSRHDGRGMPEVRLGAIDLTPSAPRPLGSTGLPCRFFPHRFPRAEGWVQLPRRAPRRPLRGRAPPWRCTRGHETHVEDPSDGARRGRAPRPRWRGSPPPDLPDRLPAVGHGGAAPRTHPSRGGGCPRGRRRADARAARLARRPPPRPAPHDGGRRPVHGLRVRRRRPQPAGLGAGCARLTTAEVHGPRMARWARVAGYRWMLATDGVWHHVVDLRTGRCCTIVEPALYPGTEVMARALGCGPDLDHRLSRVVAMLDAFETSVETAFCQVDPAVFGARFRDAGVGDHPDLVQDVLRGSVSGRRRRREEMRLAFAEVGVSPGRGAARGARRTADRAAVRSPLARRAALTARASGAGDRPPRRLTARGQCAWLSRRLAARSPAARPGAWAHTALEKAPISRSPLHDIINSATVLQCPQGCH